MSKSGLFHKPAPRDTNNGQRENNRMVARPNLIIETNKDSQDLTGKNTGKTVTEPHSSPARIAR